MAFWRTARMTRLRFHRPSFCQFRLANKLSSSSTVSALREFYLSVHPDFFAQHPQIQKINESSLKRLNSYLEALQNTRQIKNLEPVKVAFYFRKEKQDSQSRLGDFKLVNFTLRSHDLLTNIEHILDSCGLPVTDLEHVVQKETEREKELPLEKRFRRTTKFEDVYPFSSEERGEERVSEISLRKWLRQNVQDIRNEQESSRSIRESNDDLKNDICLNFGLREIAWCSPWQHRSEQGILRNFRRFCVQDKVQCLQGKRLLFTDRTMAAADESICLNVEDVPQQWLQFLSQYTANHFELFGKAKSLDDIVCEKYGNIQVVRPKVRLSRFREHSLVSISMYLKLLEVFTKKLKSLPNDDELKILPWSLRNHELTFASLQNPDDEKITVFSNGRLRVDGDCDPRYLQGFLLQNKVSLDEKKYFNASAKSRTAQLVKLCKEKFKVTALAKDFDVTYDQMSECCERLLQNSTGFNILLTGLGIRITQNYYSVFDHGHFCIPWDWKA